MLGHANVRWCSFFVFFMDIENLLLIQILITAHDQWSKILQPLSFSLLAMLVGFGVESKSGVLCLSQVSCYSQSTSLEVQLPINPSSSMLVLWSTQWHFIWTADWNHFNVDDLRRLDPWPQWCWCSALPVRVWVPFRPIFCYCSNIVAKDH